MCRIRFSLAGIHFDDYELCEPIAVLEDDHQPLFSNVPLVVGGKTQRSLSKRASVAERNTKGQKLGRVHAAPSTATSPPITDVDETKQTSEPLPPSHSNGDVKSETSKLKSEKKPTEEEETKKGDAATATKPTTTTSTVNSKTPTTSDSKEETPIQKPRSILKQVRFSDMVEERKVPEEDASDEKSDTSYDSYTDPPPPMKPSRFLETDSYTPAGEVNNFVHCEGPSSDESGIDTGSTPVWHERLEKGRHLSSGSSSTRSPASQSWASSDLDSTIDFEGRDNENTRFHRQRKNSPFASNAEARRTSRAQSALPEPIIVVRSSKRDKVNHETSFESPGTNRFGEEASMPRVKRRVKHESPSLNEPPGENDPDLSLLYRDV